MTPAQAGHLAMLAFSVLIAGSFGLGSLAANEMAPEALTAVRYWIATVAIGTAAFVMNGRAAIPRRPYWRYPVLGGLLVVYFVLMFEGLKTAPPVSSAAVFTLTPLMAAGFGWLLMRQRLTPWMAAALLIGAVGALWVIFRADLAALMRFEIGRGEAIFFWGCLAHALYTPLVRFLNHGETALSFSFGMILAGMVLLTVWATPSLIATDWAALPGIVWITILYTALCASSFTFVLMQFATLRLPASKVMAYTYLTPAWVILWDAGLGADWPPASILFGVGLTALALVMLLRNEGQEGR